MAWPDSTLPPPGPLRNLLEPTRGPLPPPLRSEIFGPERFAQHGRSLGDTHRASRSAARAATFFPRLRDNILALREAHRHIGRHAVTGHDISPAAEWLLENFHLIEAQLKEVHEGLPRSYFRTLPVLLDEPLAGLPRVYGIAWAFVAHTDGAFDEALWARFLCAYQETQALNLSEMWALPTTLRVVLIENLRRLAERVAANQAAREVANLCCDRLDTCTVPALDDLLARLERRGVARVFLAQMWQRLQAGPPAHPADAQRDWLRHALPDPAAAQAQHGADQAADNLSVGNAVTALRAIGHADWPDIVARTSVLMRLMLGNAVFAAEATGTRDHTLHGIEKLAARSGRGEAAVAQVLLDLMHEAEAAGTADPVASHWLHGAGQAELHQQLGLGTGWPHAVALPWRALSRRLRLPAYLGALALGTLGLVAWAGPGGPFAWLAAALMLLPASEAVGAVLNRLIGESVRPGHLPRLALAGGIPPAHRVLVVVPALLTDAASTHALAHRLRLHYLANPEPQAQFALLTDWADADTAHLASDTGLLEDATRRIQALNRRHPRTDTPRFILLHRARHFSTSEQRWIGWERKRGKLELLVDALALGTSTAFIDLGDDSRIAADTPYILTLDSDTQLPPGRLRELVGVAAHPQNRPVLDAAGRSVVQGYGILQPRVATPLPAAEEFTPFHWLFAGQCGTDPYNAASSELHQDVFGEGSFTGKGLLDVRAMHAVLSGRLPDGRVLSHDLLEGSMARCATVTDVTLLEPAPCHADVAAARVHRWTRGDWQLLPFLFGPALRAVHRWKMFDNLRRSLVAPASLALLLLSLGGAGPAPGAALALVLAALCAGPLLGALAGFTPHTDNLAKRHFYGQAATGLARVLLGGLWLLALLPQQALLALDAIARALYRMAVSRRHLLQWTTSAAAQTQARTGLAALARQHWRLPAAAALMLLGLFAAGTPHPAFALALCLLWAASPLAIWWASRPRPARAGLAPRERAALEGIARDTWRFFERCVGPEDRHLPPDNLQSSPHDMVAHRTSPTNIGMYLLSTACARAFGWIGTHAMLERMEATLATLHTLRRHRGHFLNWYDTQTGEPLLPMYVSTVDSGNLGGHLLATAQACRERARAPLDPSASAHALRASRQRLAPLLHDLPQGSALARLLALPDPPAPCGDPDDTLLSEAGQELAALLDEQSDAPLLWCLGDHLATLRSARLDARRGDAPAATRRLLALAHAFEQLAAQADYAFLYHPRRRLLHIGYRIAEQQLDTAFYDLLASESRLTSLLAIAKGDVPVTHWASLGRLAFAVGRQAGVRSWTGSMFEYLMPSLVLAEPRGSVLRDACHAALKEQIAYAQAHGVPWGISESAYAASDQTLAYQYAPQGVPRLALRRTPADELVVAPYATALAAQIAPALACANFAALQALGARSRYGFIEALDFSPERQTGQAGKERFTPVHTVMAHHQGMSIVALANVLLDGAAQRWGMADPHIEAVASLLHERAPRAVSRLATPPRAPLALEPRRTPGLQREWQPGAQALEPTHLLSNGRYSVSLRPNGAGCSRWGATGITRWRDDALRDEHGSFLFLRRPGGAAAPLVSLTQHPAPDPGARYACTFHADRVCFDADWGELQTRATVWVSPEDDIEFRQVEVRNLGTEAVEIELVSAFDVTLCDPRADEGHPAFTGLFVSAEWRAAQQALVFRRRPRLPTEPALQMAHFLAGAEAQVLGLRHQTDRRHWRGRNRAAGQPQAAFASGDSALDAVADTGLDPVCVLAVRLRIAPQSKACLTFATAASDNGGTLHAVVDKYRQASHIQRALLMSATLAGIRLRAAAFSADAFAAVQLLTTALVFSLTRPPRDHSGDSAACDRRLLWRFGLSGERSLILVSVSAPQGLGLLRALAQALRLWAWGGVACDLVVIDAEPASYLMALHHELTTLQQHHAGEGSASTGFHVLRADTLSADELATLQALARVRLHADGRPLAQHVQAWAEPHAQARQRRRATPSAAVARMATSAAATAPVGAFDATGAFRFEASAQSRPARPWINVLANPAFGAQLSEAGGGCTWAVNSRLNQLTAWSNDPVADPPSEWLLLQDLKTRQAWSVAPSAWGDAGASYHVSHGQGHSSIAHRHGDLAVSATWCVDPDTSVKQIALRIVNHGEGTRQLRAIGIAEWLMGAGRADRATVHTALQRQRLGENEDGHMLTALLCTQRERAAGFGGGTAFFAVAGPHGDAEDWTCDRRECFDTQGRPSLPDRFGRQQGDGLDPCAALATPLTLTAGATVERVFLLGYADNVDAARQLAAEAASVPAARRQQAVADTWDRLLGATTVKTPDPLLDALVNRWLLYQAVACRLWAKAGFYQAGGATGFRDQLQDTLALAWAAPGMLRQQIVLCASRQFAQGDVQHWWHAPTGAGVRTRFSDDLLWLPHACAHYLRATGDHALLDQQVPFIEGAAVPEGAEDAYYTPDVSHQEASVYEHAARAMDRSLPVGAHGLPLMGGGDWNDGMNRVGIEGRGESVWLGWFLCRLVADFVPTARARGDHARAQRWETAAQGWRQALAGPAWDGQWYKRAFFDDGQALGSQANAEGRIDLIAQAWAVLSGAAPEDRQRLAMDAVERHLVDADAGLIRLLDPPLVHAQPSAGYIQAYPGGVRENGGQYAHAGVWAVMALAELAHRSSRPQRDAEQVYRYFCFLSPAHRSRDPAQGAAYGIEPYVMAGDVYTQPPYVGRGGWSWYTGAAAWMHRAVVESMFGLRQEAHTLSLHPCLPPHWPQAELTLRRDGRSLRFILCRAAPEAALAACPGARLLNPGEPLDWQGLPDHSCFVVPLPGNSP